MGQADAGEAAHVSGSRITQAIDSGIHIFVLRDVTQSLTAVRRLVGRSSIPEGAGIMSHHTHPNHIETTETLLRLYVFLTQFIDRCQDEAARKTYPEDELQAHLTATRAKVSDITKVNPVVQAKVEKECERVLTLGARCLKGGTEKVSALDVLDAERAMLRSKTIALSDLLAVFRAQT